MRTNCKRPWVLSSKLEATGISWHEGRSVRVTYGVYLDLDALDSLAIKISKNKNRKGRSGPVRIEVHSKEVVNAN